MPLAPSIVSFGDDSHGRGETGLTVTGAGFGPFQISTGGLWMYENSDRTGQSDALTVETWGDMTLSNVSIPGTTNNASGTVYLFVQRSDLAWSQPHTFTLEAEEASASLSDEAISADSIVALAQAYAMLADGGQAGDEWVAALASAGQSDFQAAAEALAVIMPTVGAVASFEDVVNALESFAATAQADGGSSDQFTAGDSFSATSVTANEGIFEDAANAAAQFLSAAQAFAALSDGMSVSDAILAIVTTATSLSEGISAGSAFSGSLAGIQGIFSDAVSFSDDQKGTAAATSQQVDVVDVGADLFASASGGSIFDDQATFGDAFISQRAVEALGHLTMGSIAIAATLQGMAGAKPTVDASVGMSGTLTGKPTIH